jgi:lysozyme
MADKENGEDILRAILEKGSDKAKKAAADALTQHPPAPDEHPEIKQEKKKVRRKGLKKAVAAKIGNSKYYHHPETGAIVDELGQPAPKKIAEQLVKEKVAPAAKAPRKEQSVPELAKLKKELAGIGQLSSKTIQTNSQMISSAAVTFEQFQNVLSNFATQNSKILDTMVQQNADFHEKVIEALTGVKGPTKSSGETKTTAPTSGPKKGKGTPKGSKYQKRVGAMAPPQKKAQAARVQQRAEHIEAIRTKKTVGTIAKAGAIGAVGGAVAGTVVGAIAGVQKTTPSGPSVGEMNARTLGPNGGNLPTQPAQTRVEQEAAQPPQQTQEAAPPAGAPSRAPAAPAAPSGGAAGGGGLEATAREMLIRHEGKRNAPYKDSKGLWTVGIGHLIGDGRSLPPNMNRTLSDAEVFELFAKDYAHHAQAAANIPGYDKINDMGKVALVDLTFNMGQVWYKKWPNFTKAMSEGNWQQAANSLEQSAWYRQVGRRAPEIVGLIRAGGSGGGAIGAPTGGAVAGAGGAAGAAPAPTAPAGAPEKLSPEKMTALNAAKAANQAAATVPPAPPAPAATTAAGAAQQANQAASGQASGEKPKNVTFESGKVDVSKVDPKLLKAFYQAAAEYGKPVRINSAYRGDEYQAQLWVRANVFHEAGVHIPAKPSQTTTINYKGQSYTVPGSGKGSAHGRGQAMDVDPKVGSPFERILNKYGVGFILGAKDPPHIQLIGGSNFTPPGGGEAPAGSPNVAATPAPTTAVEGARMANESADRAIAQGTAPAGIRTVVVNNTNTVTNTRTINRAGSSLPNPCPPRGRGGYNPFEMAAGALLGKAMSRLF